MSRMMISLAVLICLGEAPLAADDYGLKTGQPQLKTAGALAFGPDGILFVGDSASAAVFAIATDDSKTTRGAVNAANIGEKVAAALGTSANDIRINDLAVNPASGQVYLSITRGQGSDRQPALVRVSPDNQLTVLSLENIPFARAEMPDAFGPDAKDRRGRPKRVNSITDLEYVDGRVFVAGLANEEFESTLRSIPFPFTSVDRGAGVRIFHGSHGRFETNSPVRTFTYFKIGSEPYILAAYTCTPLVKFRVADLKAGAQIQGTTVAELGNRNTPLDMVVYNKDSKNYMLVANTSRGVMKITTEKVDSIDGITSRVADKAGLKYETIAELQGVQQLDRLDDGHAIVLIQDRKTGATSLKTVALP